MKRAVALVVNNWPLKLAAVGVAILLYAGLVLAQNAQRWDGRVPILAQGYPADAVLVSMEPADVTEIRFFAPAEVAAQITGETFKAYADLSAIDPQTGSDFARVEVVAIDERITILDFSPTSVRVELDPLVTRTVPIEVDVGEVPPELQVGDPMLTAEEAVASGPESVVRLIDHAVARVTIQPSGLDVDEDVTLLPVDAFGTVLSKVDLDPAVVGIRIRVGTSIDTRSLPVRPITTGAPATGFVVTAITVEPATVTVSGDSDALAEVDAIDTSPISIAGARADISASVPLAPPTDLEVVGDAEVTVTISIGPVQGSRTFASGLVLVGARLDRVYTLSTSQVSVVIGGTIAELDRLDPASFTATLDVTTLGVGRHTVPVEVLNLPAGLRVNSISPSSVVVDVAAAPSSPTPEPSPSPAPSPSP